jgi:hypothetical protein
MESKPLPFQSYRLFYEKYARATELLLTYNHEFGTMGFNVVSKNPPKWQKFKFLVKHIEISLKSLLDNGLWNAIELGGTIIDYEHIVIQAQRAWTAAGIKNCPDMATIKAKYYYITETLYKC